MNAALSVIEDLGEDDVTIDGDVKTVGTIIALGAIPGINNGQQKLEGKRVMRR